MPNSIKQSGFSLVELVIVIMVIGFLIGSVIGTSHLVRKVRLNKVVEKAEIINQRIQTFRELYRAYPGDFERAEEVWGSSADCNLPSLGVATCNGNGNGVVQLNGEHFRLWQHLANAGMFEGAWTGVAASPLFTSNVNVPGGFLARSVYVVHGEGMEYGATGHRIYFTGEGNNLGIAAIAPASLAALDAKFDDGMPMSGRINALAGTGGAGDCLNAGAYNATNPYEACRMVYWLP